MCLIIQLTSRIQICLSTDTGVNALLMVRVGLALMALAVDEFCLKGTQDRFLQETRKYNHLFKCAYNRA